ncbi:unnamed protein product [Phytomonas sp. EM1]|nr:unnamed protein product [Phytomonas sp. EM1]|eukprot:CCW62128.1 unnamed protein product [Phytomonas sp. isolate EM1]
MTKLVKKLKQMEKKRSHRKTVQKRKIERVQRQVENEKREQDTQFEREVDVEIDRVNQQHASFHNSQSEGGNGSIGAQNPKGSLGVSESRLATKQLIGGIVVEAPARKNKKQLTRKQMKRKSKMMEHGEAVQDALSKKWIHKRMRVKLRAQIRNQDLHN